ncbi:MAG TPA: MBL fold metallo-hydrolase [Bryobacteraceae bacterium]|nr:MBL fold metallo-hydrolase [Bryobacteraceae bacterium]
MQILPGLYSLGDKSGGYVRSYLVEDQGELTLIDALLDKKGSLVLDEIRAMGKKPTDIKRIIMTHAHQSHLGGLKALKDVTGARVYSHDWEAEIIEGRKKVQVPKTTTFFPQKPLKVYPLQVAFVLGLGVPPPCEVDESLKDGDHVGPLTVMHAPGHTPGSMAFYWPEKKALIVGDMVTTWPELALGWPQITLDNRQNRESVGKLCDMVDAEVLCTGHGDPIRQGGAEVMRTLVKAGDKAARA